MRITRTSRSRIVLPALLTGALLLSACGGSDTTVTTGTTPSAAATSAGARAGEAKNAADVDFVSGMIPHHGQAIDMADVASRRATNAKVKDLAGRVKAAQSPEIATLAGLLTGWGEPVPAATGHSTGMPGMDHGDMGMMSAKQMSDLGKASGAEFDRMWVDMMIAHHQGAVTMSQAAIAGGSNAQAQQLAQTIIDAQTKEIGELQLLRTELA
jgi:uncharacterized protein (DUF305 family)